MPFVGGKAKPAGLRELEGNRGHNGPVLPDIVQQALKDGRIKPSPNRLKPPKPLEGREAEIWEEFINPIPWITWVDRYAAYHFVKLAARMESDVKFSKSEHHALRQIQAELGLTPSSRARKISNKVKERMEKGAKRIGQLEALMGKEMPEEPKPKKAA